MLSKAVSEDQNDWNTKLGSVVMAYNSAVHESICFTPWAKDETSSRFYCTTSPGTGSFTDKLWQEVENNTGKCISVCPREFANCSQKAEDWL